MFKRALYIFVIVLTTISCGRSSNDSANYIRVDSLYADLSDARYSNISAFDSIAKELSYVADEEDEPQMVATNALAYSAMMQMDYSHSVELYSIVLENSACEIERLVADVGLMTVCYRVSANRLFFDYRIAALSRIRRINEEYAFLSASDRERFNRAKVEFAIVSLCYFSNLAMQNEAGKALEHLERNVEDIEDISLRLYARMMLGNSETDIKKRLSSLLAGVTIAKNLESIWLEGNYRLLLAISLRDNNVMELFAKEFADRIALLLPKGVAQNELPDVLAKSAYEAFERYGDEYMMIEALAVDASCKTRLGNYNEALLLLSEAYDRITNFYQKGYPDYSLTELDSMFYSNGYGKGLLTNIDSGIFHIPECLLSVCREASCAYAGLGDKIASDVNRELYLDLLRTTRLNKRLESRTSIIENKVRGLRITAISTLILFMVFLLYLLLIHRRRMVREKLFSKQRKNLLKVCRMMFTSLPHDIDNKQQLFVAITDLLNENMCDFSGQTHFVISETPEYSDLPHINRFTIPFTTSDNSDVLTIASEHPLDSDKVSLIEMLMPYIAVAIEEGMRLYDISEERERVEEAKCSSAIYLAEHKRENILKRVSVSIVSNMRTFMDRISNELKSLKQQLPSDDVKRKLQYISELTEKLDDLNLILERWIKTRQGEVNLRIENFFLSDLFAIIEKNNKLFDARGLSLIVKPTDKEVKADKALTLFMINTLVDNAAKFTPAGGSVVLECVEGNGFIEVSVTDTGIGMSENDVNRILGTKVYDSSQIGSDNNLLKPKSKGDGFGLMNCKGIIEKYRKTDSFFSVCSFGVSSIKGEGSRFSFRLPKGIMRCILLLISLIPITMSANDDLFEQLDAYADSVFMCNVNGNYKNAYTVAENAIGLLNSYYRSEIGGEDTLTLHSGKAAELLWLNKSLFQDSLKENIYHNILDIRNELAVASLALNNWDSYNYNNKVYSTLYRVIHEDSETAEHYAYIQQIANRYEVAIAISCFLIFIMLVYYVVTFVRHNIIEKTNERLVLEMNNRLLDVTTRSGRRSVKELAQDIVNELYACLGETMRISEVALLLDTGKGEANVFAVAPVSTTQSRDSLYSQQAYTSTEPVVVSSGTMCTIPLYALNEGERVSVGVLEVATERPLNENETLSLEFISNYLASVAYHSAMRVAYGYTALEELEEEAARMRYEENRLHVQNMVMDNCLSVIKHETIYYPSRIKELSGQAILSGDDTQAVIADMRELMEYYSSVFGILSNCAIRELDGTSFKFKKTELMHLFRNAKRCAERMLRKYGLNVEIICEDTDAVVHVDSDIVEYLFEQLFAAAFRIKRDGKIVLRAINSGELVTIEFVDNRYEITNDEASNLFTPTRQNFESTNGVNGMENLVAKEIVRLHEDYTGKHGGRMEARSDVSETVIMFTLPK